MKKISLISFSFSSEPYAILFFIIKSSITWTESKRTLCWPFSQYAGAKALTLSVGYWVLFAFDSDVIIASLPGFKVIFHLSSQPKMFYWRSRPTVELYERDNDILQQRAQVLQPVESPSLCGLRSKMVFEMEWCRACYWEDAAWGLQMKTCWRTKCVSAVSPVANIGEAFVICLMCLFVCSWNLYLWEPKVCKAVCKSAEVLVAYFLTSSFSGLGLECNHLA